jgi:sugar lactone lactonase YvrE
MKNLKKILTIFILVLVASCSNDNDNTNNEPSPNPVAISSIGPTTGGKNTSVVLIGRGFSDNAASNIVTLNGKPCTVNQASTTQLNITIPPAAGTGNIIVTVAGNSAQSTLFTFIDTITVSTIAGSTEGFSNGTGTDAQFSLPAGVAVNASGIIYVADRDNHKIRKITPAGVVTTFAGSTIGSQDGNGTSAKFNWPTSLTVDPNGNVYVADYGNHKIRKITPTGDVTTLAGSTLGFADGTGINAKFNYPWDLVLDANGNLYTSDLRNHKIRKITPTGVVTTIAGNTEGYADGIGTNAQFNFPSGIDLDAAGNLYVTDGLNNKIRKITAAGVVTTIAGNTLGFADGTGLEAQFNNPIGLVIDTNDNLYVADSNNHRIRKITPAGVVTTIAGSIGGFADGLGANSKFSIPSGLEIDNSGVLYVADLDNHKIRKIIID